MLPTIADPAIDWTSIIITAITAASAMFAAYMASRAARAAKTNTAMLKTNSGLTVGQHIEAFRGTLEAMAAEKTQADAQLVAAALAAVAKLATKDEPLPISEQAVAAADMLLVTADQTAVTLKDSKRP